MSSDVVPGPDGPAAADTAEVVTTASDGWRASVALHGEIDAAVAPRLRTEVERHLAAGCRVIRIDAGDVTFIDSTAIGELVHGAERCQAAHSSLILTNVPARVRRVIQLAGLDSALLVDTAGDAE